MVKTIATAAESSHTDGNQQFSLVAVQGTLGTADVAGTAKTVALGANETTGALYVQDLSGASGTTNIQGSVLITGGTVLNTGTNVNVITGTLQLLTTVSNLTNGSVNLLTGTIQNSGNGTVVGGTLNNLATGTINALAAGTITGGTLQNLVSGTINALAAGTITGGTLQNLVSGTINALAAGTITTGTVSVTTGTIATGSLSNLALINAGTITAVGLGTAYKGVPAALAGSFTAAGSVVITGSQLDAAWFDLQGTWVGTTFFEGQVGTSSWFAIQSVSNTGVIGTQTTGNGDFLVSMAAVDGARARLTFASGTQTYNARASNFFAPIASLIGGSLGTLGGAGVVTTVTTVSNLTNGSVNLLTGTQQLLGTLQLGTIRYDPTTIPQMLQQGTLGTAGGSFFGTLSAASGAGTKQYIQGVDVVMQSGTADVRILAGSAIQGTGVLAAGNFVPGGGISKNWVPHFQTGTNAEITYHFVGAGTAFINLSYWKGA